MFVIVPIYNSGGQAVVRVIIVTCESRLINKNPNSIIIMLN